MTLASWITEPVTIEEAARIAPGMRFFSPDDRWSEFVTDESDTGFARRICSKITACPADEATARGLGRTPPEWWGQIDEGRTWDDKPWVRFTGVKRKHIIFQRDGDGFVIWKSSDMPLQIPEDALEEIVRRLKAVPA